MAYLLNFIGFFVFRMMGRFSPVQTTYQIKGIQNEKKT